MGNQGRREYLRPTYDRYGAAGPKGRQLNLSEFCANTGYHRKHAIRLLNGPRPEQRPVRPKRRRRGQDGKACRGLSATEGEGKRA